MGKIRFCILASAQSVTWQLAVQTMQFAYGILIPAHVFSKQRHEAMHWQLFGCMTMLWSSQVETARFVCMTGQREKISRVSWAFMRMTQLSVTLTLFSLRILTAKTGHNSQSCTGLARRR